MTENDAADLSQNVLILLIHAFGKDLKLRIKDWEEVWSSIPAQAFAVTTVAEGSDLIVEAIPLNAETSSLIMGMQQKVGEG